jgi:hypothetical protein
MLPLSELAVTVGPYEDVKVKVFGAVACLVRIRATSRVLLQPPLADQVHQDQAILVDVIQQVPQPRQDSQRHVLHGA